MTQRAGAERERVLPDASSVEISSEMPAPSLPRPAHRMVPCPLVTLTDVTATIPRASIGTDAPIRLTQYAHGGGCACKIPPGELEDVVAGLVPWTSPDLVVG